MATDNISHVRLFSIPDGQIKVAIVWLQVFSD